ncbi:hypothetical protein Mapa_012689 [Marchantia paleacea]|nr:hypothetical protein Mapa_012689 [Marchantia paleacea]
MLINVRRNHTQGNLIENFLLVMTVLPLPKIAKLNSFKTYDVQTSKRMTSHSQLVIIFNEHNQRLLVNTNFSP